MIDDTQTKADIAALQAQISTTQTQLDSLNSQLAEKNAQLASIVFFNTLEGLTPAQVTSYNEQLTADGSKNTILYTP